MDRSTQRSLPRIIAALRDHTITTPGMRIAVGAVLYFAIVFSVGFLLGTVRIFLVEPHLGLTAAALCEAPFLLAAIVVAAGGVPRVVRIERAVPALALMGFGALFLQQMADFAVGIGLRNLAPSGQLAHFATAPGLIYAALLAAFAVMPCLVAQVSEA
jgi:hypothetical protein